MKIINSGLSRSRFIVWGIGILASFSAGGLLHFRKSRQGVRFEKKNLKMLDRQGRLVEVDAALVECSKRKISDEELQEWIKTDPKTNRNPHEK